MAERPSRFRAGRVVRIAVAAAFTAAIVALAASTLSVESLSKAFSSVTLVPALLALGAYVAVNTVRACRFLLSGARVPFRVLFCIAAVHSALLRVMPLRSGELAYGILLKRTGGGGFGAGVATILMIRILDFATILPVGAAILALGLVRASSGLAIAAVVVAGVGLGALFFLLGPVSRAVARFMSARSPDGFLARTASTLAETYGLPLGRRVALMAITLGLWALILGWFFLSLYACGIRLGAVHGLVVGVLGVLGSTLPVSLVGTFGPMEGGIALGLAAVGHTPDAAAATALVTSVLTFLANWVLALPAWLVLVLSGALGGRGKETGSAR
ncbi:MAG: lysylphosphatidylglycerol synthase domain-containing protein [Deltaproteobacteria bacterium]|nr:lysylphosphatidylglycerol synthase domain-containing protein [Deltaproteobacteria bacterium]